MQDPDEEQRYREELEREYVRLKVELAQIQSDTERHKLLSNKLSNETGQLRSAISQSQNAEREMRDLARQLGDEVSNLQREVQVKEEERDKVKAEAERTQEQRAQLERTLEVLGGRKVTELLNARRTAAGGGQIGDVEGSVGGSSSVNGGSVADSSVFSESKESGCGPNSRSARGGIRKLGESFRTSLKRESMDNSTSGGDDLSHTCPSVHGPDAFLFDKDGRGGEEKSQDEDFGGSGALRLTMMDFMKGLDKEC
mmetsp:Transcript_11703/g.24461  ORF Transcript_11703/g.24461 Transcript_11703/m.24461 type:complete len:255 (-) Transcript_11703:111-875(-)|eukprot:CAMPEP_0183320976 /NCGR_PEP_ID=MMETSP0160_2-20130417/67733_1 /TAXON_ID=2839 ORGANISM="Odontella Sinensis, Strain Grunow 1884" /NCGR_SAMPLE_ID=MMETSP0160_2 /ASSEMBLY_ACC=CAM_ASM_000250 /LENGTH=254 /DNA_ID=CAMNT_0025487799 /DNA_START=49 /DNA_END=813 /DNA_ORIENTATION=-